MTMIDLPPLPSGIYEHYKGDEYFVLGYTHDSTDHACTCHQHPTMAHVAPCPKVGEHQIYVAYFSMRQIMHSEPRFSWHIREQGQFHHRVCWSRGCALWGKPVGPDKHRPATHTVHPRFRYLRPA